MVPNLNKWKYIKLHKKKRVINLGKGNKGKTLSIYNSGIILTSNNLITINQFEALKKYINKKLKNKNKINRKNFKQKVVVDKKKTILKEKTIIYRSQFNLGLTAKPLQVRMGKGKGAPVSWVYPFAKNRVLLEFLTQKFKKRRLLRIFKKASNKLSAKAKIKLIMKKKKINLVKFRNFDKKKNQITCVKGL